MGRSPHVKRTRLSHEKQGIEPYCGSYASSLGKKSFSGDVNRLPKQATVDSDLLDLLMDRAAAFIEQHKAIDACVRSVEQPESIVPYLDWKPSWKSVTVFPLLLFIRSDFQIGELRGAERHH